jgi:glycosyltransferase involved in cell wall biosynthesis
MRIDYLMVTPSYAPRVGGVEKHVAEVHRALAERKLSGRVVVFQELPDSAVAQPDVEWMPERRLLGWIPRTVRVARFLQIRRMLAASPTAVLHFHDYVTLLPFLPLLRLSGRLDRTFVTFHGWEGQCPPDPNVVRARRRCANAVAGNIAIGDFIPKWYGTPADVVSYGGVSATRYALEFPDAAALPFRIAYLGRLEPDTGVLQLVDGLQTAIERTGKPIELALFGNGSLADTLAARRNPRLQLTVHAPVRDTSAILADYPIIAASGYLSILEALCARRIVFAFYDNPLREDYLRLHPQSASMFFCGGAEDFSRHLQTCRADLPAIARASEPAWAWAREQTWDRVADAYARLWNSRLSRAIDPGRSEKLS